MTLASAFSGAVGVRDSGKLHRGFPVGSANTDLPAVQETSVQPLGREDLLEKGMATPSRILAWRIPWAEEPGGLQAFGSQRIRRPGDWLPRRRAGKRGSECVDTSVSAPFLCLFSSC